MSCAVRGRDTRNETIKANTRYSCVNVAHYATQSVELRATDVNMEH